MGSVEPPGRELRHLEVFAGAGAATILAQTIVIPIDF
jgi:hypothetical protein